MYDSHCMPSVQRSTHAEGRTARAIEKQTAELPSDVFLWSALGALGLSCGLHAAGRKHLSLFIGQWASPLLILGLYNKLVKLHGSDAGGEVGEYYDREASAETVVEPRTHFHDDRYEIEPIHDRRLEPDGARKHEQGEELEEGAAYRQHVENEFGTAGTPIGSPSTDSYAPPAYDPASLLPRPTESHYLS